ncbi:hypothetical protein BASA81_016591 [Batrachochytrium salamandrivorans]|nr:hypothetical protein BASA81_016591 [Batrachochytrium salamandrivorans]
MTESSSIDLLGKSALVEKTVLGTFYDQLAIMLHKNTLLQYRYLGSTIAQALLAPLVFSLIMFLLQQADYASQVMPEASLHMPANQLQGVQRCQGVEPGKPCVTIMYAIEPAPLNDSAPIRPLAEALVPSDVNYTKILETFSILNQKRVGYRLNFEQPFTNYSTPATQIYDIVQVPSSQFIYNHTLQQSNVTAWAITFTQPVAATPINVQYQVWYNDKNVASGSDLYGRDLVSFVRGMDEAIISVLNDPTATITADLDISIQDWAELPSSDIISRVYQKLGPAFFFCSEMIVFINVMSQIVTEKELKLRHGMEVMGLMPGVYWLSHFISTSALVIVNGLSMVAWGFAFGFPTITHTNIAITIITFILFGEAMVLMAFFMTTFLKRTNNAILMAIFIFIIGLLLQAFVFSDPQTSYVLWTHGYLEIGYVYVMYFLPFFNFGHIFVDISTVTFGRVDAQTGTKSQGGSFQWSNMFSPLPQNLVPAYNQAEGVNVPLPIQAWYMLIMNCFFYGLLMWYFDNVLPDEFGAKRPPYFFLTPAYWGLEGAEASDTNLRDWVKRFSTGDQVMEVEDDEDDDVKAARERALDPEQYPAVKIVNLRKVYGKTGLFDTGEKEKVAVRSSCFTVDEGKLFALLGQNGAGKSTTISILAGLTPATSGDALMYNLSVRHQSQRIRRSMGICPQHDILFDDLTAREHIELYAGIKGVARSTIKNLVEERLKVVRLHTVADVRAGTYSGGMKRRLSLVISTIGDPRVIFMDEPTTGMDPVNRRCVWSFIEKFKQGRVIMLTTHSMEEADVLGDEVGIMSNGRIRAVNNAIALKTKFGAGYHVSIVTDVADSEKVEAIVHDIVPDAVLSDKSGGALLYQFPASSKTAVPKLVGWLETNAEGLVKSWGIGQTTLEEVFLKLVRESNTLFSVRDEEEAKMRLKVYKKRK